MGRSLVKVLCMMMLAAVGAAGVSCSRPVSYEKFVSVEDREANGLYSYTIDLSDSLCTYDVSFYSRIDATTARRCISVCSMTVRGPTPIPDSMSSLTGNPSCR